MSNVHPTFAPFLASIAPPPGNKCVYCAGLGHEMHDDQWCKEQTRIAADLAYNQDKAHRLNNEAFIKSMKEQINDQTGAFK